MPARRFSHLPARFLIFISTSLLPSCLLLEKPLFDPEKAKPDTQLFGAWKISGSDGEKLKKSEFGLLLIGKSGIRGAPPGIGKMILCGIDKENEIDTVNSPYFFCNRSPLLGKRHTFAWDTAEVEGNLGRFRPELAPNTVQQWSFPGSGERLLFSFSPLTEAVVT